MLIAQPLPHTLLSLPRYARLIQCNPVHFAGAVGTSIFPIGTNSCNDVWPRYSWQASDRVSHYDLAISIRNAEFEIARELGWFPAPRWIAEEIHQWPRFYRREFYRYGGYNLRGQRVGIKTDFAKIIAPGQRAVTTKLATATVAGGSLEYTDEDGDGFSETATVEISTTLTNADEIKIYFADTEGVQEWEIRPPRQKSISGGTFTAVFDSWLFIDPDLLAAYPTTAGFGAVDITTTANYVTSVDIYREYNNTTDTSVTLYWEPEPRGTVAEGFCSLCSGSGCEACALTTQDGCLHIRDANLGIVVPTPGTYNSATGAWTQDAFTYCRDPDFVKLWYYAGDLSNKWRGGYGVYQEKLSDYWAEAIMWLATARLERPFCSCGPVIALFQKLQDDLAAMSSREQQAQSYQIDPADVLQNPFGTRRGEVMAWSRVKNAKGRVVSGGII